MFMNPQLEFTHPEAITDLNEHIVLGLLSHIRSRAQQHISL